MDLPWIKRQLVVRGAIIPLRFRQSAGQYSQLWTKKGSPLLVHGIAVKEKLQEVLGKQFHVTLAMRYQAPSLEKELKAFEKARVDHLIIFPLFPQYASATTGSVHQKVMEELASWLVMPKLTFIDHFFDHPAFIESVSRRAKEHPSDSFDHVIFSFHGLPERQIRKADDSGKCLTKECCSKICSHNRFCYKAQCYATARAIASQLNWSEKNYTICFQSRLGKEPWLEPYAMDVLQQCIDKGLKRLLVLSPAFVCDCLETTYEIGQEYRNHFIHSGGESLQLVAGLNDHPSWIEALRTIILEQL